jgi:hypothetical protein
VAEDWNDTYRPVPLIDGATKLLLLAGVPSGATVIKAITPAVAAAGDAMPKGSEAVVVPDAVSSTVIDTVPGSAIIAAVTGALMSVLVPD